MKVKSISVILLVWFACQSLGVLADALTPITHDESVFSHATHCDTDAEPVAPKNHDRPDSAAEQSCGQECQCCASCSSPLADNGRITRVSAHFGVIGPRYISRLLSSATDSLFRPPISA